MSEDNLSRRNFLAGLATTGATATFVAAQTSGHPVVITNQPLTETKPSGAVIKIVCAEKLTPAEVEQIRAAGKNIELRLFADRAELQNNIADAEVILGGVDREILLAAKKLKWVQA